MKRDVAFLSMDVVDSTGLKKGEDTSVAERDFRQYKHLVEHALSECGVLKSTWTPDGVMAAFSDTKAAIRAAHDTIQSLGDFNAKIKKMRGDFKIRAGINAGPVLYDDKTPMEEMSDRVIDVAGHMQKYGSVNSICVPSDLTANLPAECDFKSAARKVDGYDVSEWAIAPEPAKRS